MKQPRGTARGRLFLTPRARGWWPRGSEQHGIMILNARGKLLWYSHRPWVARDLKVVRYDGRPMLAFYQGVPPGSRENSYYALLDDRYRLVRRIYARPGYRTDTHELQLTPHGTAYIFARRRVWHAPVRARVIDWVIQEIDVASGDLLFEWHSLDHVPPSASYLPRPSERIPPPRSPRAAWDYFHGNSIDISRLPTLVVSARNTSAVYAISRETGRILWTLGGKQDDFDIVRGHRAWQFCAQHDARWLPNGDISLFDNGGLALFAGRGCRVHDSRVEVFRVDGRERTARRVRTFSSRPSSESGTGLRAWAMGSARRLPNGNTLVDWGTTGRVTEVAPNGDVRFGLRLARYSYRAIRAPWVGRPAAPPRIAVSCAGGRPRVSVSWNGATQVRSWRILAVAPRVRARRVAGVRFRGLETSTVLTTRPRYVRAVAVGANRRVLARSRVTPARC
jgi:hypothetical protein